jgi:putative sterol carrier protein
LKPFLTGVLVIEFPDSGERFVFDWRDDTPKTHAISRDVAVLVDQPSGPSVEPTKVSADALIMIADKHVMAVRSGDLNPQVGMLTDKIRVKGKVASAVYLFNLIAPRVRS